MESNGFPAFYGSGLSDVRFASGSEYEALMKKNLDYMMRLDRERLLYNYRRIAGRDTKGAESYGAWISPSGGGAGQFEAHYIIALAKATLSMPDYRYQGVSALDVLRYMIGELDACQKAFAEKFPEEAGYIGAILPDHYTAVEEGREHASDGSYVWVPWYFYHKQLEALLDVYRCSDGALRDTAREMLIKAADWAYRRTAGVSLKTRERILKKEYGGMAEVLYQIYALTGEIRQFQTAEFFEEKEFLEAIFKGEDRLTGLHANTTIPKFLGCAARYEVTGDEMYKEICIRAFDMILTRTYANGSTGRAEFWPEREAVFEANDSSETCCSYNMLKLADYLFRWTGQKRYADYFENVYTNHILASMDPDTGLKTYLTNTAFGYYKIYHSREHSFWCCACTGMESFAKLTDGIYYRSDDAVAVNMFYPSAYRIGDSLELIQSGDFFKEQKTCFTIRGHGAFTLKLRYPCWAERGAKILINGASAGLKADAEGFLNLKREWKDGDRVEYSVPFSFRLEPLKGNPRKKALFYGPALLVALAGRKEVEDIQENQLSFGTPYKGSLTDRIVLSKRDLAENMKPGREGDDTVLLQSRNHGEIPFAPFNRVFHERYGMYFEFLFPEEPCEK